MVSVPHVGIARETVNLGRYGKRVVDEDTLDLDSAGFANGIGAHPELPGRRLLLIVENL